MRLGDFYQTCIRIGWAADVHSRETVDDQLASSRREYEALPEHLKPYYDRERLTNPFGDTRIAVGSEDVELRTAMIGIIVDPPEILTAAYLRDRGQRIDALIAHHPVGVARGTNPWEEEPVVGLLTSYGVPRAAIEGAIQDEVARRRAEYDDFQITAVEEARRHGFALACVHNPADYCLRRYLEAKLDEARPQQVGDVVALLLTIPEFRPSMAIGAWPRVVAGDPDRPAGRVVAKVAGWIFPLVAYPLMAAAGVGTVVQFGRSHAHYQAAAQCGINVVCLPHYGADSLGVNLVLDDVERLHGPLDVIGCHGFTRVRREGADAFSVLG